MTGDRGERHRAGRVRGRTAGPPRSPASRSGPARRSCSCTGSPPPAATSSTAPRSWLGAAIGRSPTTPAATASPTPPRPMVATPIGELVADLDAVLDAEVGDRRAACSPATRWGRTPRVAYALAHGERLAGLVVIGPAYMGFVDEEALAGWDRLADGLERGGVEGFMEAYDRGLDPDWRETVLRITRRRMLRAPPPGCGRAGPARGAALGALRGARRSSSSASCRRSSSPATTRPIRAIPMRSPTPMRRDCPRPAWSARPRVSLPLAWQGGRLSREIASFCAEPAVAERL